MALDECDSLCDLVVEENIPPTVGPQALTASTAAAVVQCSSFGLHVSHYLVKMAESSHTTMRRAGNRSWSCFRVGRKASSRVVPAGARDSRTSPWMFKTMNGQRC